MGNAQHTPSPYSNDKLRQVAYVKLHNVDRRRKRAGDDLSWGERNSSATYNNHGSTSISQQGHTNHNGCTLPNCRICAPRRLEESQRLQDLDRARQFEREEELERTRTVFRDAHNASCLSLESRMLRLFEEIDEREMRRRSRKQKGIDGTVCSIKSGCAGWRQLQEVAQRLGLAISPELCKELVSPARFGGEASTIMSSCNILDGDEENILEYRTFCKLFGATPTTNVASDCRDAMVVDMVAATTQAERKHSPERAAANALADEDAGFDSDSSYSSYSSSYSSYSSSYYSESEDGEAHSEIQVSSFVSRGNDCSSGSHSRVRVVAEVARSRSQPELSVRWKRPVRKPATVGAHRAQIHRQAHRQQPGSTSAGQLAQVAGRGCATSKTAAAAPAAATTRTLPQRSDPHSDTAPSLSAPAAFNFADHLRKQQARADKAKKAKAWQDFRRAERVRAADAEAQQQRAHELRILVPAMRRQVRALEGRKRELLARVAQLEDKKRREGASDGVRLRLLHAYSREAEGADLPKQKLQWPKPKPKKKKKLTRKQREQKQKQEADCRVKRTEDLKARLRRGIIMRRKRAALSSS